MPSILQPRFTRLLAAAALSFAAIGAQAAKPDPAGAPDQFVLNVANQTLDVLKASSQKDTARINQVVDQNILPYVDFQKTTRLAAGRHWREATEQQRTDLSQAFRGTLVRTYSGALTRVNDNTSIKLMPQRASDVQGDDAVVRSAIYSTANSQPVEVDYRLGKSSQGWRIYDLNVEGVWLIENYRNQFAQQIGQNGIEGLIKALNERNGAN